MRQAQAGFGQLIASPKRRKIVHLLSEKNSEIQPKQKLWVSDHLASWHCIQAWPNLQKHPSWGKKIHSQLQWLAPWDDIPNSCLQIPNQSNHLQSHRPGNFGADEVGISESKLWEFICLIPQRYSLTTRCKQKICWLQFAPKKSRKMPEVRRFSNNQVAGSILKEILNHLYVADFQAWSWDVFLPLGAQCPVLLLVIHHEDQGFSLVVIFVGKKTSQCQHFQQQKVNTSREMPKGICVWTVKSCLSAMPSLYILLCQTTCSINIRLLKWNRIIAAGFVGVQNQQRLVHPRKRTSGKPNNWSFVSFFFLLKKSIFRVRCR